MKADQRKMDIFLEKKTKRRETKIASNLCGKMAAGHEQNSLKWSLFTFRGAP